MVTNRKIRLLLYVNFSLLHFYNFRLFHSSYLQSGSYPVVSPKNGRFPENMKPLGRFHNLTFNPENGEHSLLVTGPLPGHWFMLAHSTDRKDLGFAQEVSEQGGKLQTWNSKICLLRGKRKPQKALPKSIDSLSLQNSKPNFRTTIYS